jgi:hypothetical protein
MPGSDAQNPVHVLEDVDWGTEMFFHRCEKGGYLSVEAGYASSVFVLCFLLLSCPGAARAGAAPDFAQRPSVRKKSAGEDISFAVKAVCDVAVAVEGPDGRIVRHIAGGLLGPKAAEPFKKDTLSQTVHWDGRDDRGDPVDPNKTWRIRVSLGLKARFERTLCPPPRSVRTCSGTPGHGPRTGMP